MSNRRPKTKGSNELRSLMNWKRKYRTRFINYRPFQGYMQIMDAVLN